MTRLNFLTFFSSISYLSLEWTQKCSHHLGFHQGPLVCGINIAVNDWFLVEVADQERAIYGNVDTTLFRHLPLLTSATFLRENNAQGSSF